MGGGQVVLLRNLSVCVTREMRRVDGFDTVELLEQVLACLVVLIYIYIYIYILN